MFHIELFGYFASFLTSISLAPQLVRTLKTRSTKDISVYWTIVRMFALSIWIFYAMITGILPLLICVIIELFMISFLFSLKNIYK